MQIIKLPYTNDDLIFSFQHVNRGDEINYTNGDLKVSVNTEAEILYNKDQIGANKEIYIVKFLVSGKIILKCDSDTCEQINENLLTSLYLVLKIISIPPPSTVGG